MTAVTKLNGEFTPTAQADYTSTHQCYSSSTVIIADLLLSAVLPWLPCRGPAGFFPGCSCSPGVLLWFPDWVPCREALLLLLPPATGDCNLQGPAAEHKRQGRCNNKQTPGLHAVGGWVGILYVITIGATSVFNLREKVNTNQVFPNAKATHCCFSFIMFIHWGGT